VRVKSISSFDEQAKSLARMGSALLDAYRNQGSLLPPPEN
jgi:hypothetical protein